MGKFLPSVTCRAAAASRHSRVARMRRDHLVGASFTSEEASKSRTLRCSKRIFTLFAVLMKSKCWRLESEPRQLCFHHNEVTVMENHRHLHHLLCAHAEKVWVPSHLPQTHRRSGMNKDPQWRGTPRSSVVRFHCHTLQTWSDTALPSLSSSSSRSLSLARSLSLSTKPPSVQLRASEQLWKPQIEEIWLPCRKIKKPPSTLTLWAPYATTCCLW